MFFLLSLLCLASACLAHEHYQTSKSTVNTNSNWMSQIPDSRSLRDLSIPGTHNSVSFYGKVYARCQTLPLSQQFKAGIRFLDIRIHHDAENELPIYHGIKYQRTNFNTVLKDTVTFLNKYPGEVIFMRIREESKEDDISQSLLSSVLNYVNRYPANRFWMSINWPSLYEARGKIVILQNFDTHHYIWVPYSSMSIDDHWNVKNLLKHNLSKKWRYVEEHLTKSMQNVDSRIHLTYVSGASALAPAYSVAKRMNENLLKFLRRKPLKYYQHLGIIAMDFPGDALIQKIVLSNFVLDDIN